MNVANYQWRKLKNSFMQALTCACALLVIAPLGLVFFHLIKSGFGALNLDFFTQLPKPVGETGGGMANAIVGTFVLLGLAALIGVPVGVLGGVYLSEYGFSSFNWWIRFGADILNGVPSIIWGIVVNGLIVARTFSLHGHVILKKGFSALSGGVVLGLIMIPLIMRATEEVLLL